MGSINGIKKVSRIRLICPARNISKRAYRKEGVEKGAGLGERRRWGGNYEKVRQKWVDWAGVSVGRKEGADTSGLDPERGVS